jgi:tetratricopeptide (TPR) repeat protein
LKYFRKVYAALPPRLTLVIAVVLAVVSLAWATVEWKNVESGSAIENALYRLMPMPVRKVLGLRPPREAVQQLAELVRQQPTAELYSLRALNEEAALDFTAAEADWKKHAETAAADKTQAQLALADYYHRRLRPVDEVAALSVAARAASSPTEKLTPVPQQRSWLAFERIQKVVQESALPLETSQASYRSWIERYPDQRFVYSRYLQFLLTHKLWADADKLIAQYRKAFPEDGEIFQVKAQALLEYRKGAVEQGLAVYDARFQPLWPAELIQGYFELLRETRSLRKYLDSARATLERNPDDLNAAARIYYYYQQQGRNDAAAQALADYRLRKEQRNAPWTSQELYTLARLYEGMRSYPEAAGYYYALYNSKGMADAQELALAGLANVLLEAPEQPIRLGSGELSMYRDVATLDPGPGFLNGILSLVLNSTAPEYRYSEEEQRAVPYFHRVEAASLARMLDARFPSSTRRPALRARLLETYAVYGDSNAVIRDGQQFLSAFPQTSQRSQVALLMADAYARTNRAQEEFPIYDSLLAELAKKAEGVPLGSESSAVSSYQEQMEAQSGGEEAAAGEEEGEEGTPSPPRRAAARRAFSIEAKPAAQVSGLRSPEYSRVLERYLSRLVSLNQAPQALAVLRKEIDRNPNDPGLYERLAQFLEQNRLGEQQEQVYQRAMQQFPDRNWYHKLARFYLRYKRKADFERLSEQVIKTFSGTDLESYFSDVVHDRDYYRRLNEYALNRFPHDLTFVRNLLNDYSFGSGDWERLLGNHWFEAEDLRNRYFEYLSRTGKLESQLAALRQNEPAAQQGKWQEVAAGNPLATRFIAEAGFWRSHFEEAAAPMGALAQQFPADAELGRRASAVFRSLAAFDAANTNRAVAIEENLYQAAPGDRDTLARIGDILADRELFARAAPYWNRMAQVRPGESQAWLDAATVFWDYYRFDNALGLLNEGRTKLQNPALFSYEIGAIDENKREYPQAVAEYVKGALAEAEGSRSRNRLLELARRPRHRDTVDKAVAPLAQGASPDLEAVKLYTEVLETQNRTKDLESLLAGVSQRSSSLEMLEWVEETARQKSLVAVQQAALEKQATLVTDPVRRLELRYSLVRFYESRKNLEAAQRNVDVLYRETPKILGVVRATVDFYWHSPQRQRAVDVLLAAANDAYPTLRTQFTYEAARKATELGQYDQARKLLTQLLADAPFNDEYLAATAETFARAGDDQGLKTFYLQKIDLIRKAPLAADVRDRQVAGLRRGLIPALTRLKDYTGAEDQYIEVINKYPEDDSLVSEAALFGQRYGLQSRLLNFYSATVKQSPRDYRWPIVLARMETQLEDYPAAIDAYGAAIKVRPDRVDLRTARAELLERLMRFDEAAGEYQRLFELNYHDTNWMEKVAEIRARQSKVAETVAALKTALIENRPEKPENYFEVARRLETWGMLAPARDFAQRGVDSAGRDLLAVGEHQGGAELYARILTRLRQQEAAYQRLQTALADATSLPASASVAVQQVQKNGIAAITDKQWRDRTLAIRRDTARSGLQASLRSMGVVVNRSFTPEEKAAFATFVEANASRADNSDLAAFFVPTAQAAGLADQEARWTERLLMSHGPNAASWKNPLARLQSRRLRFDELGAQLQRYAATLRPEHGRYAVQQEAAEAYRAGGNYTAELGVLADMETRLLDVNRQRYFALLLQYRPERLVELAGGGGNISDPAAQYVLAHGEPTLALRAVSARGRTLPPVWTKAYTGTTGLYFADRSPDIKTAFLGALGDATIGERIGRPVVREQQLAGNTWFYYGSRYGEWLGVTKSGDPEDFLPAELELSPASASGYVTTAEYYADQGDIGRAIQDYGHTLELAPGRADIHDRIAVLYWRQQKRAEAIAERKQALDILGTQVNQRNIPENFLLTFRNILDHLGSRHALPELRPQADAVLRDYVRHNGVYQVDDLLSSAFLATGDAQSGTAWMLELAAVAPDPTAFLRKLAQVGWIPLSAREPIYLQLLERLQEHVRSADGLAKGYAENDLAEWQLRWARYLVRTKQYERAGAVLDALPKDRPASASQLELMYRVAIERNQLDAILDQYRAAPEHAPAADVLQQAARALQDAGQRPAARKIFEYVFSQQIAVHSLTSANFLGLAEIRLQDGDTKGALELLHRLILVVGRPFENLDAAALLLVRTGHHAEAVEFLNQLVKAVPWDTGYRLRLAQEQIAAGQDATAARAAAASIAADIQSKYEDRINAALLVAGSGVSRLGSGELDAVAVGGPIMPELADRPFFYAARVSAAEKATSPEVRERLLHNALNDTPERDAARIPLFLTLISLNREQLAISTLQPLLQDGFLRRARRAPPETEYERAENPAESEDDVAPLSRRQAQELEKIPVAQRASLAFAVGRAYAKLNELNTALTYLSLASKLEVSKATRAEIDRQISSIRATIRREAANARRAPMFHPQLEQDHVVRPRLVAEAKAPPKTVAQPKKGGVGQ